MTDAVAERKKREKLQREQHAADLKAVLELPQGRRALAHLIFDVCSLQAVGFSTDPHQHAYYDGQRRIGLELDARARVADLRLWALMHQERITAIASQLPDDAGNKTDQ